MPRRDRGLRAVKLTFEPNAGALVMVMLVSGRFIENFFDWREKRRDAKRQVAN